MYRKRITALTSVSPAYAGSPHMDLSRTITICKREAGEPSINDDH